ncbi:alpha/beta hydrolase [uncultured Roseovarius sp.]|uniref:alpha/beta fold hydrolase n=1 Tax=uncultured Roseovarius sp. TaxID=293344 RepID=UPI002621CC09|nr:alpha/beta hydrolase [uncultured Roseovarius sp.]
MHEAPLFDDVAYGPEGGAAWWLTAADGVRLRVGLWNRQGPKGTILLFPGRTEYIEKYGRAATHFAGCGYATLAIDWRGQGLSDRLTEDAMAGHVHHFIDYQQDVIAMSEAAKRLDLPRPWYLLAHSMGGCIGLRAVIEGLDVQSCAFSSPMWGIHMAQALRPVAWSLSWGSRQLGMSHRYAPGTAGEHYVLAEPFETNKLTNDREMYDDMARQLRAHPELGLGGPSLHWLHEALRETRDLARLPSPALPCLTILGSDEQIVDVPRVHERMAQWPGGHLDVVPGGRHETLMDTQDMRKRLLQQLCDFYGSAARLGSSGPAPRASAAPQAH